MRNKKYNIVEKVSAILIFSLMIAFVGGCLFLFKMEKTNNILYVMAYKNFQDEEYFETKKIFENSGYKTKISSSINCLIRVALLSFIILFRFKHEKL